MMATPILISAGSNNLTKPRQRLALIEAADLSWFVGDRIFYTKDFSV